MKKYLFIGLGGGLGAILRFIIKNIEIYNYKENIPLNTFVINITGSFVLGFILTITYEKWKLNGDIKLGITAGFLGAYTTFSTMCKETIMLLKEGYYFSAISYIGLSVMLGITAANFGSIISNEIAYKLSIMENNHLEIASDDDSEAEGDGV